MITSGCQFFDRAPAKPIGYSKDENGRACATYENGSKRVYQTECDYGGQYPTSVNNPLSKSVGARRYPRLEENKRVLNVFSSGPAVCLSRSSMFGERRSSLTESQKHFTSHLSRKRSASSRSSHLSSLTEDSDDIISIAFFRGHLWRKLLFGSSKGRPSIASPQFS